MDYVESINRQRYQNYVVVFVDDASKDGTIDLLTSYLKMKPNLKEKFKIVDQKEKGRKYALYNHNLAIRQYCPP